GHFFYPRQGYGQLSRSIATAARELGADIRLCSTIRKIDLGDPHRLEVESKGQLSTIKADHIWSTVPVTVLSRLARPSAPASVIKASEQIVYRAMILIYLVLDQPQWTPFDAHYFPESEIPLTRLSEPKNYSGRGEPSDRTVLCAELPCMVDDDVWQSTDEHLGFLVQDSLAKCGLQINASILSVTTKRLQFAY